MFSQETNLLWKQPLGQITNLHEIQLKMHNWTHEKPAGSSLALISKQSHDPYFDDGCNLLSHHWALQREPPHLQKEQLWVSMTVKHTQNASSGCLIWGNLIKRKKTAAHHEVSATTEHFSGDTAVRTAGVFRIQNITGGKKHTQKPHWAARLVCLMCIFKSSFYTTPLICVKHFVIC